MRELQDGRARLVTPAGAAPAWVWEVPEPAVAGRADVRTLLLLHGWMANAGLNWGHTFGYLGRSFRVVAPNLRGHGHGGLGSPPFSLAGCADDLAALIDELGLERPIAVGYSMGGAVAQVLALRHGPRLGGVVLCATGPHFARRVKLRPAVRVVGGALAGAARAQPAWATRVLEWRLQRHDLAMARRGRGDAAAPADGADVRPGPTPLEVAAAASADGAAPAGRMPDRQAAFEERRLSHLAAFIESGVELNAYDSTEWLPALRVPAAVVVTSRDRIVPPWRQESLAALIPGARRYVVDAGHDAVVTDAAAFLPVLVRACTDLAASGE
ncbi:MAG TPA: alpha/beta hydrolase [Acidimicrobiales bacterium]|nr:alpha/beta hydrolase [Acidimicrobiales bacterium]